MIRLSYSRIATYQECQRKYKLAFIDDIQPKKQPGYFTLGNAMHKFLETYYSKIANPEKVIKPIFDEIREKAGDNLSQDAAYDLDVDQAIVEGIAKAYPLRYPNDFELYPNFLTEKDAAIKVIRVGAKGAQEFEYYGKLDILAQDKEGNWWVMDHKTATTIDPNYLTAAKLSWQTIGYMFLAKKILGGVWPKGVVYNVIKKPGIRLKKTETASQFVQRVFKEYTGPNGVNYFARQEIIYDKGVLEEWQKESSFIGAEIVRKQGNEKAQFVKNTGSCLAKFGTCKFIDICSNGGKVSPLLFKKERVYV